MSITFNPITGNFDEVEIPLNVLTNIPIMTVNGDLKIVYLGGTAYLYWYSNGQVYRATAIQG